MLCVITLLALVPSSFLLGQASAACKPPTIVKEPSSPIIYFSAGDERTLLCAANGDSKPTYVWRKNGKHFRDVKNLADGKLVIDKMKSKDAGFYQCEVKNKYGVATSLTVQLKEAVLRDFREKSSKSKNHSSKPGESLTLPCDPPMSVPNAIVIWVMIHRDGGFSEVQAESSNDGRVIMDPNFNLHFSNVLSRDALDIPYACMATNPILKVNSFGPRHFIKVAEGTPRNHPVRALYSSPKDIEVLKKETLTIKCIFGGYPTPRVEWSRVDRRAMSQRVSASLNELRIDNVQLVDGGLYECRVRNAMPRGLSRQFKVTVASKPVFIQRPRTTETGKGGMAVFKCTADGIPKPVVTWTVDGQELSKSVAKSHHLRRIDANTIQIDEARSDDNMVVQCNASNRHGYAIHRSYVCVRPDAPEITKPPKAEVKVEVNNGVNLTCQVANKGPLNVRWLKDGIAVKLADDRFKVLANNNLHIKSVTENDAGMYKCEAKNRRGLTTASRAGKLTVCKGDNCPSGGDVIKSLPLLLHFMLAVVLLLCFMSDY